jgi:dTDP-4-amino-4,6-dideoxygalactose transaminase
MRKVKFVEPVKVYNMIKDEIDAAYFEVMSKGDLIDRGQLKSFEENLAKFVGTKYAVGLNSGYDALHLSLRAAGIGPGDEVIVPAHTFVASCSAIVNVGATPVLVDVGKDFNIDCEEIEKAIEDRRQKAGGRIRAIMAVHLSGYMADMVRIMEIAEKYNLVVIEDACQSLGSSMENQKTGDRRQKSEDRRQEAGEKRMAGSWGLTGCWSFYPFKILGGYGDGGAITTNDPDVALFATRMRYNGEDRDTGEYHGHGFTCLLDNMQAAFLDVKLRYLPSWIIRRKEIAERYRQALSDLPDLLLPHYDDPRRDHIYQNYTLRSKQGSEFSDFLKANGIEVLTQFRKPYYKHEALKLEDRGFPETEALSREVCSLPMNVEISEDEIDYVIEVVRKFYKK